MMITNAAKTIRSGIISMLSDFLTRFEFIFKTGKTSLKYRARAKMPAIITNSIPIELIAIDLNWPNLLLLRAGGFNQIQ